MANTTRSSMSKGNQGIIVTNGDFNAGQVAVGDRARAVMQTGAGSDVVIGSRSRDPSGSEASREAYRAALQTLLEELKAALQSAPAQRSDEAELLAAQASQLVKAANRDEPSRSVLQRIGNGLKESAGFLKEAVPQAITITGQLVDLVAKLHGLGL
jgi:hypothetical protein